MQHGTIDRETWWLYLLLCENGRLYIGIAKDVDKRFRAHCEGKGAFFTRMNRPSRILGRRAYATRGDALRAEYAMKQLGKDAKLHWARCNAHDNARDA